MKKSHAQLLLVLLLLTAAMPVFAQTDDLIPKGMVSLAESILGIFTGGFMKTVFIILFLGAAVAYGYNKDNEKMKMKMLAILITIGIIGSAQWVVGKIWDSSMAGG